MTLIRLCFTIAIGLFALFAAPDAFAQANRNGDDQPGLIANPDDEQLDPKWQKTVVFYPHHRAARHDHRRTATSAISMWCSPAGGRCATASASAATASLGRASSRSRSKKEWPDWTPPEEMIQRQPYLPRWMAGGPGNPLGARAMYLGTTVYRIHGTNQPQTIGTAVSSGCFRLTNPDVADLYERIPVGTKVIIRQRPEV